MGKTRRIGLIGFGAIGRQLAQNLPQANAELVCVLQRSPKVLPPDVAATPDLYTFLAAKPDLAVECAGHEALKAFGPPILKAGCDLIVASAGALAPDPACFYGRR